MTTAVAAASQPRPQPPEPRLRWHILAAVVGTILAAGSAFLVFAHWPLPGAAVVLTALLWAVAAGPFSSLGYAVPGLLALVVAVTSFFGVSFTTTTLGGSGTSGAEGAGAAGSWPLPFSLITLAGLAFGLAIAMHFARRDGRGRLRDDARRAALRANMAPTSRLWAHILAPVIGGLFGLAAGAVLASGQDRLTLFVAAMLLLAVGVSGGYSALGPLGGAAGIGLGAVGFMWLETGGGFAGGWLAGLGPVWGLAVVAACAALAVRLARSAGRTFELEDLS